MYNDMIIDGRDNVAVAIEPIAKGDTVTYSDGDGKKQLTEQQDVYKRQDSN